MQAKLWKTKLGIEPICLLFGDRSKTNMSEEHGKVIEVPIMAEWPLLIQITWSKFFWPTLEPDSTYLVGDIDLLPLQTAYFKEVVEQIPSDHYAHLDADGITQLSRVPHSWTGIDIRQKEMPDFGCPSNLPGHYHCAKGSMFKKALNQGDSFEAEIKHIVVSGQYNNVRGYRECDPIEQHNLWCAEELRSTRAIRQNLIENRIRFSGLSLVHGIGRTSGDRVDKTIYDEHEGEYKIDEERLKAGKYVDLHCVRPFVHYLAKDVCDRRWAATVKLLKKAGMLD